MEHVCDILLLSESDLIQCINYKEVINDIEYAWKKTAENKVVQHRTVLNQGKGVFHEISGYVPGMPFSVVLTQIFPENIAKHNLPGVGSRIMMLYDTETGLAKAMISGYGYLGGAVTGAVSGVTAKYLAKKDSRRICIIGAGQQGVSHFLALKELFPLQEVRIHDRSREMMERYVSSMGTYGIPIVPCDTVKEGMKGADIVMAVTTADAPLIHHDWIEHGMTILKIGSFQEMEPEVITSCDKVVVDWWEHVEPRSKEMHMLVEKGLISQQELDERKFLYGELPNIAAGQLKGRENDSERIISIQLGLSVTFTAVCHHVYKRAQELGLGKHLDIINGELK